MSGTYDLMRFIERPDPTDYFFVSSPLHFVPTLAGRHLDVLRTRHIHLASGEGKWENIGESFRLGEGARRHGHPELGRVVGQGVGPRLGDLAREDAEVPRRVDASAEARSRLRASELTMEATRATTRRRPASSREPSARVTCARSSPICARSSACSPRACSSAASRTIGAEQEMFLVDRAFNAAPRALEMIEQRRRPALHDRARSLQPRDERRSAAARRRGPRADGGAAHRALRERAARRRASSTSSRCSPGILPTLARTDLSLENMVPNPRYLTLNRVMRAARATATTSRSRASTSSSPSTTRSCSRRATRASRCTSSRRSGALRSRLRHRAAPARADARGRDELADALRQAPLGRDAHRALRAVVRHPHAFAPRARRTRRASRSARAGRRRGGALEHLQGQRHALPAARRHERRRRTRSRCSIAAARPRAAALRLHNGTIYRWNRACYGISANGKPHLRIELRVLPVGPVDRRRGRERGVLARPHERALARRSKTSRRGWTSITRRRTSTTPRATVSRRASLARRRRGHRAAVHPRSAPAARRGRPRARRRRRRRREAVPRHRRRARSHAAHRLALGAPLARRA